jgi:hypothetical protein
MSATFNDEYLKTLSERGLALVSKRFAVQMGIDANARREDLEKILFGDGVNYGIVSVLSLYYAQIWRGQGRKTSEPLLHDPILAKSQYQADFSLSVTIKGDGDRGLHPPQADNPAAGQDDVDINSLWLTTHGLDTDPTGTGINQLIQALLNTIGVAASANGDGRGPYTTQALAQAQAAKDRGSGLLGLRTGNSEIYSTESTEPADPPDDPVLQWWIGRNGIDTPDNFTTKAVLISGLANIRNELNGMVSLFQTTRAMLQGEGRAILDGFKVELPIGDIPALNQAISQFQNFSSEIQRHIDYFNQYADSSPSEERSAVNARLESVKTYVQNVINGVNNRCEGIPALMGNVSSGLNKHLTHWIAEVVKKPDGPYAMILGAQTMLAMSETNIQKKNENLNFFERDCNLWMEPTLIQTIYDRAVMNPDKTINRFETDIMWNLVQAANKYKALSKPFSDIPTPLSNAEWDESSGVWVTNKLESGFLNNIRTIPSPTVTTMFRVVSFDTNEGAAGDFQRTDAFNTKSKQTDIISEDLPFNQQPNAEGPDGVMRSVVFFNEAVAKQVKERDFLWLNESEIAQIIGIFDSNYMLDTDYGTITSLRKLIGLYYVVPRRR